MSISIDELADLDLFGKEDIIKTPTLREVYQGKVRLREYLASIPDKLFGGFYSYFS